MAVQPIDWNAGGNVSLGDMVRSDQAHAERRGRSRIAGLIEPALGGDRAAMAGVFQGSPEMGTRIAHAVGGLELGKQRQLREYTDFVTRGGMGVMSLPPDQQGAAYVQLLTEAQGRGYPLQGVPTEWGPQAKQFLQMQVNRAMPFARYFKTQGGGGGGGGGAPAGGGGWGGPTAPRVSDAGPAPGGPMVADAGQPPMQPTPLPAPAVGQGGAPGAPQPVARPPQAPPQPQMAAAPMPMDLAPPPQPAPQPPQGAPQAPPAQFSAPGGPMMAQSLPAPQTAPVAQPAPPPTQMAAAPAEGGGVSDDSGESRFVGGADAERAFKLNPGESIKVAPKDGKPITDSGGVWVQAKDGSVEWRLLDPQGRPIRVQQVDLGDRVRIIGADGQTIEEISKGRLPAEPAKPPAGYEPRPDQPGALRPIEGGPATDKLRQFDTSARDVFGAADRFLEVFTAQGGGGINTFLNNPRDPKAQTLLTAYNNMIMSLRGEGFANTGVLQPAEIKMLQDQFLSPETMRGAMASPEAMRAKIDELKRYVQAKREAAFGASGVPLPQGGQASPPTRPPGAAAAPGAGPPAAGGPPKRLRFNPATGELE